MFIREEGDWGSWANWVKAVNCNMTHISWLIMLIGLPGDSVVKNLSDKQETRVRCLGWEDTLEREMENHASILAGKSHGQKSLEGYSAWVLKGLGHNLVTKQQQQNNSELARKANLRMKQG